MKYIYFILISVLPVPFLMAQTVPQGLSPLGIGGYESITNIVPADGAAPQNVLQQKFPMSVGTYGNTTNTAPETGFNLQNVPQQTLPLIPGTYGISTNKVPQAEAAAATNQVNSARISFLMNTGIQYADAGEYQEAERAYLRALENDPGNSGIRFSLSTLYIQMERYKEAADILKSLATEFPENALVNNNLAWIYSTGGNMKNGKLAVRHAREAILSAPIEASMWNTLAEAYFVSGQYDKALRASEYAIDLLRLQNAKEEDIAVFQLQHTKIQRAQKAAERILNLDDKE